MSLIAAIKEAQLSVRMEHARLVFAALPEDDASDWEMLGLPFDLLCETPEYIAEYCRNAGVELEDKNAQ